MYRSNKISHVFALFHLPADQLMWYLSIGCLNLSHLSSPIGNSLLINAQFLGELLLFASCLLINFVQLCFQFHIFEILLRFSTFFVFNLKVITFETPKPLFTHIGQENMLNVPFVEITSTGFITDPCPRNQL